MVNNSDIGQAIYEPFLGSGTTLIAAESTGRVCYGIEIDPVFVDVVIRRWQAFTGQHAVRWMDSMTFDDAAEQIDALASSVAAPMSRRPPNARSSSQADAA